jgi:hypothetical protein
MGSLENWGKLLTGRVAFPKSGARVKTAHLYVSLTQVTGLTSDMPRSDTSCEAMPWPSILPAGKFDRNEFVKL